MKLLVVCQHYWPENFRINDIVEGFLERGHEVDVLCGQPNYPTGEFFDGYDSHSIKEEMHGKVKVYRTFEIKRGSNSNLRIFLNYMAFPIASAFQVGRLKKNHYDKVYIYQLSPVMMSYAGIRIAQKKKIGCAMYVLDIWPQNLYSVIPIKNKLLRKFLYSWSMWYYKKPEQLITVSEKMRQYFLTVLGKKKEDITFIPQCPEKLYEQTVHDPELEARFSEGFRIVYTGNISPAQDVESITQAAAMCVKEGMTDLRFIIVGDGMSRSHWEDLIAEARLNDYFIFEGFHPIEDIPKYTALADALLGTLSKDGLQDFSIPAKVMSYLAAGRPLLLAMEGEPEEIIQKADCGFCSKPGDAKALAGNIKALHAMNAEKRKQLGDNARAYQQANFERNRSIDQMLEVIERA